MMKSLEVFLDDLNAVQQQEQTSGIGTPASENNSPFNGLQFARFEQVDVTKQVDPDSPEALYQKLQSQWDISFPQASLWGVLACAACFAGTIVREKSRGTLVRLQAAPVSRAQIVAGKALACFLMVMLVLLMMTVLGVALGMRPRNWPMLIVASLAVAYCFVGIMMLMSIMGRTEEAVAGASWGANMVMAMFGGGMIPLAFLPGIMQTLSHLSPVKWAILALEGSIWRGFSAMEMLLPLSVLLTVGTLGLAVGTLILRRRMEQV
jgi:ABC-2 type transport system permease protein